MHALVPMQVCRPRLSQLLLLTEAGVIAVAYARRSLRKLQSCRSDWPSRHEGRWAKISGQVDLMGVAPAARVPARIRVGLIGRRLLCKSVGAHEP